MSTMVHTYGSALALINTSIPAHLEASAEVPILTSPQAQGDLLIFQTEVPEDLTWTKVAREGVQVVTGEATGNTHWLNAGFDSDGVMWHRVSDGAEDLENMTIGYVKVPAGQTALVGHTDEHGSNGLGSGTYAINGKREQADLLRRIAD